MRSPLEASVATVAALLATLLVAGCGEAEIDVDKASDFIDSAVTEQVGAQVRSVTCPDSVKVKPRDTFTCLVTGSDGTKGTARLTQKDDKGNLTFYAPFLHTKEAARVMQTQLRNRSRSTRDAVVSCPQIVVVGNGRTFDCSAKIGGNDRTVAARQTDAKGNFTYRVLTG